MDLYTQLSALPRSSRRRHSLPVAVEAAVAVEAVEAAAVQVAAAAAWEAAATAAAPPAAAVE